MIPSIGTQPVAAADTTPPAPQAPPRDRAYWTTVLHNAAQVPPDHPRYQEARSVIQMAIDGLGNIADSASAKDQQDINKGFLNPSSPIGTALVAFGHGASLGLAGDPEYLQRAHEANPKTAFISDLAGTAALAGAASPLVAGLSPVAGGAVLGGVTAGARGAIEPIPGLSRGESALVQGGVGVLAGAAVAKLASKLVPIAQTVAGNIRGLIGGSASSAEAQGVTEAAVRAELTRLRVRPDVLERTIQQWRMEPHPVMPAAAAETPTAIGSKPGTTVEPVPTAAQRGLTRAQYAYRQAVVAGKQPPAGSVAPPADPLRLQQLKMLLQLPNDQFEAASSFFPKSLMDEMRAVRLQYHGPSGPKL